MSSQIQTTQPTVGRNPDGRLEAFARSQNDDKVWHIWQNAPNGTWGCWTPLDGTGFAYDRSVAVGTNKNGSMEIFAVTKEGAIKHRWQTYGGWSAWSTLEGRVLGSPRVANNADGRLEIFVVGLDHRLYHRWQVPGGGWNAGWESIGDNTSWLFSTTHDQPDVAVARNSDGRLEVFGIGGDNGVYHTWQDSANGSWNGQWYPMSGFTASGLNMLEVGTNADGRLEVFGVDKNGTAWSNWQTNGQWSGWNAFSTPGQLTTAIGVGRNADGRLEVFATGAPEYYLGHQVKRVYHRWQNSANGANGWSGWARVSGGGAGAHAPVTANNADGRMEVFTAAAFPGALPYHAWQNAEGWSEWEGLGH